MCDCCEGMLRWVGRVALVTGASSGIGADICRQLVKKGMIVVGCARNVEAIEAMAQEMAEYTGKLHALKCDMTVEEDILAMHKEIRRKFNRIDVCINNAMTTKNVSLVTGDTKDWRYIIELGIIGLCINTRESIKLMKEMDIKDGHIINMGCIVGHKIPPASKDPHNLEWYHIYNSVKWMVRALSEGLRQEIKAMNSEIRVTTLSPGAVETGLYAKGTDERRAELHFAQHQVLKTKDVASAVVYVLSTRNYVNVHDIIMEHLEYQI